MDEYSFVCNNCCKSNFPTETDFANHAQICGSGLRCKKCKRTEFPLFSLYKNHIDVCGLKRCMFCHEWIDGTEFHSLSSAKTEGQWKRDMEITNKLIAQGWRPLRFTGNDLQYDMDDCLNQIASLL